MKAMAFNVTAWQLPPWSILEYFHQVHSAFGCEWSKHRLCFSKKRMRISQKTGITKALWPSLGARGSLSECLKGRSWDKSRLHKLLCQKQLRVNTHFLSTWEPRMRLLLSLLVTSGYIMVLTGRPNSKPLPEWSAPTSRAGVKGNFPSHLAGLTLSTVNKMGCLEVREGVLETRES